MICPKCGTDNTLVIDSRQMGRERRRRYRCNDCGERFVTWEIEAGRWETTKAIAQKCRSCGTLYVIKRRLRETMDALERVTGKDGGA